MIQNKIKKKSLELKPLNLAKVIDFFGDERNNH